MIVNYGGRLVHRQAAISTAQNPQEWSGAPYFMVPLNSPPNFVGMRVPTMADATTPMSFIRQWGPSVDIAVPAEMTPYGREGTPGAAQPSGLLSIPGWMIPDRVADAAKGAGVRLVVGLVAVLVIVLAVFAFVRD